MNLSCCSSITGKLSKWFSGSLPITVVRRRPGDRVGVLGGERPWRVRCSFPGWTGLQRGVEGGRGGAGRGGGDRKEEIGYLSPFRIRSTGVFCLEEIAGIFDIPIFKYEHTSQIHL